LSRLGGLDSTSCGNTSATGLIYQSKRDVAVQANIDQGGAWKACKNAGVYDDMGHAYYMSLPTDAEWLKAADWGDLNQDGTIDQNVYTANFNVNDLEGNGAQDNYVVRCHTDNNPPQPYTSNSSQTASCRSRYGAADMVGNVWEWTNGQIYEAVGNDNGVDGLWLGQTFQTISGASFGNRYDLLRGFSKSSNAPTVTNNGDFQWYASGLRGSVRGGGWDRGASVGRWAVDLGLAPAENYAVFGARCSR
jgi:formylglycine-generating enzyme required for sulfatase activity